MIEIKGIINNIVFQNKDNGYVVANLEDIEQKSITIVGYIPYILEGQSLKLIGIWVNHNKFGRQFKVESFEEIIPNSIDGIEKYLSSGVINGIGKVTAKKIVEHFKDKTFEILDNNIEKLKEIEGIGTKKIEIIKKSYCENRQIKNIIIYFQSYGITPNQCMKIYKKYGNDSIETVKENPYVLINDVSGIGFKIADRIARNIGIDKNSEFRIKSGIVYIINEFCSFGNTYMPMDKLIEKTKELLLVDKENIEKSVYDSTLEGKIKIETINDKPCVFLMPFYYCELNVTKKIITLAFAKFDDINVNMNEKINKFEEENNIQFSTSQREAIEGALTSGIEIITGGPGTGKTTIINCITEIFEEQGLTVYMAAPTGRAAKRMEEATEHEAKTIHRLLEIGVNEFDDMPFLISNSNEKLECDVIIIDEASMIDIVLMNNLMKSISIGTRVIIVGDSDQLPSVGPGNVLRDIIDSECVRVVRLKEIFRQGKQSMIVVNAHKINNGEMPLLNKKDKDFYFIKEDDNEKILKTIVSLAYKRLPNFNKKINKIEDIQVLSFTKRGILGVENLNIELQGILNPKSKSKNEKKFKDIVFRVGDKVMQIKNNYTLKWHKRYEDEEGMGVFNGDIGFITDIDNEKITVVFDDERVVYYDSLCLDELVLAYAMTIHKSQGSEFPIVIIPVFMGPQMLMNKNLLYTGITRAKNLVVLVGNLKAMKFMISNDKSFERYSSLSWRINDLLSDD